MTNEQSNVAWTARYYPFGELYYEWATTTNNIRFPGQWHDRETNLYYNWHRFYDPTTGRYLQADPIGLAGGMNMYAYVGNNPVRFFDPMGLEAWATTAQWDCEMWSLYQAYAVQRAEEYLNDGTKVTCEDFPLNIMIDFASEQGLPFDIVNGVGTYSSSSDMFNNVADFRNAVLTSTAASDLQRPENTVLIDEKQLYIGDLILQINDEGTATHTQLVTSRTANSIGIHQGTFTTLGNVHLASSNPEGRLYELPFPFNSKHSPWPSFTYIPYAGGEVQTGRFWPTEGKKTYNYRRSGGRKQPAVWENSQFRRWNFQSWGN